MNLVVENKIRYSYSTRLEKNDLPPKSVTEQFKYSRDILIAAEKNGFDSAYAYDHSIPHYRYPMRGSFFECYTLLSALSTFTKRIKLGQIVTCNSYRNPALLAKMLSTLDVITKGCIELGIGAGWYKKNTMLTVIPTSQM